MLRARFPHAMAAAAVLLCGCATLLGLDEDRELGSVDGGAAAGGSAAGSAPVGAGGAGGAGDPYFEFVKAHGGVAYFPFDDDPGAVAFANVIDTNRAASKVGAVGQESGVLGLGASFDGSSKATVADDYDFAGMAEMSIELWVNTPAPESGLQQLVSKKLGNEDGYAVTIDNQRRVTFTRTRGGSSTNVHHLLDTERDYGRFLHVVATFREASGSRLFVDGVQRGTPPAADELALVDTGELFKIAGDSGTFFTGIIDELAVYDRELTLDEIVDHFNMVPR